MFWSFVVLAIVTSQVDHDAQLQRACDFYQGQMVDQIICPTTKVKREGAFCKVNGSNEPLVFFNGCTAGFGNYEDVFFSACLQHDLCYHHEPVTSGKNKAQCDDEFYQQMKNLCLLEKDNSKRCRAAAKVFYKGVKGFGENSWQCSNVPFK